MSAVPSSANSQWEAVRLQSSLGTRDREWIVRRMENGEYRTLRCGGSRAHGNRPRRFSTKDAARTVAERENAKLLRRGVL